MEEKLKILFWGGHSEGGPGNAARSLGDLLSKKHTVSYIDQRIMRYTKFEPNGLHDVLMSETPDVLHVHSILDFAGISNIAQHGLVQYATPTVITVLGWNLRYLLPNRPMHSQFKDALLHADVITVPSEQLKTKLHEEGFGSDAVYVCDNVVTDIFSEPVHPNLIRHFKSGHGIPLNKPLVVSVGLFSPHKNPLCFFEVSKLLPKYHFVWVGAYSPCIENPNGECRKCLDIMKGDESGGGCKNIQIIELPYRDMPLLYQGASLLFHPAKLDAQPMTILEASMCKLPVLASNAGDIPRMIGDSGIKTSDAGISLSQRKLSDYKDVAGIIEDMVQRKKERGEAMFKQVKEWCVAERIEKQYLDVYIKAMEYLPITP